MIEKLLDHSIQNQGFEISFILGHRILAKTSADWFELKGDALSVSDWEDLKDFCLQSNEKVQLETKGYVVGVYQSEKFNWKFSFVEKKECYKAYLSLVNSSENLTSDIENPYFWDMVKKNKGIFLISGERKQGKSTLLSEIIENDHKDQLRLTGIHSPVNHQRWPEIDSVIHLGVDSIDYDYQHFIYDGVERVVVDMNQIKNWNKWIDFSEQGLSLLATVSSDSVQSLLQKISTDLSVSLFERFFYSLNGIIIQKFVGSGKVSSHEIICLKQSDKVKILNQFLSQKSFYQVKFSDLAADSYQSLNQSLIQRLIRRKIDVKSAFQASLDPDDLDYQLKKLGL